MRKEQPLSNLKSVNVRLATPEDAHLDTYDNTKLVAINTCPKWGIVRYVHHKAFPTNARAMALEAGSALHEVFAAVRLYQLVYHTLKDEPEEIRRAFLEYHGKRLFNTNDMPDRFEGAMLPQLDGDEDERTKRINFCLSAFYTAGYYDDPSDRRRTSSNLEECAILYIERYDFDRLNVWVRDRTDHTSDVGIEIAFDLVLSFEFDDGSIREYRFIGKFDGLMTDPRADGELIVGENKTASRMDEAWRMSFELATQLTGYMIAGSVWAGQSISRGTVYGLQVPLPKSVEGGIILEPVNREDFQFADWFDWFLHTVDIAEMYRDDPVSAPKYTHSCSRYFRPCPFISLCASSKEDQRLALEEEMVIAEWSPLHTAEGSASD